MSRYGVYSGPYFPVFGLNTEINSNVFSPNTEKYGLEKATYLDTFHAVLLSKSGTLGSKGFVEKYYEVTLM